MPFDFLPTWPLADDAIAVFGLLLADGAIGGYLTHRFNWLPSITGFMLGAFALGPSGAGFVSAETLAHSRAVIDVALGLILYRLVLSLDVRAVLASRFLMVATGVERAATLLGVWGLLAILGVPVTTALLIAAIVTSSSPAVLIHVSHELKTAGPVTDTVPPLVAMKNVIAFLVFRIVLPVFLATAHTPWQNVR